MQSGLGARNRPRQDRHAEATLGEIGQRQRRAGLERDDRRDAGRSAGGIELMTDTRPDRQRDQWAVTQCRQWNGDRAASSSP
jgi:hypothetical protein